jgi:hypothetical protein
MKAKTARPMGLRITTQYRQRQSRFYELDEQGSPLHVCVSPRQSSEDSGDWLVEVRSSRSEDALREVGRRWVTMESTRNLPVFDWDAVANVLLTVRAI